MVLHAKRGDHALTLATVDALLVRAASGHVTPPHVALAHAWAGRVDRAFDWLARAVEAHDFWLATLAVDPFVDSLRGDARLAPILRRIGTPGA